jgi:hypothetical protein
MCIHSCGPWEYNYGMPQPSARRLKFSSLICTQQWIQLGGPIHFSEGINKCALLITIINSKGGLDLPSKICRCFIIDLLLQHKFHCVTLIDSSWRMWETNLITPTYHTSFSVHFHGGCAHQTCKLEPIKYVVYFGYNVLSAYQQI